MATTATDTAAEQDTELKQGEASDPSLPLLKNKVRIVVDPEPAHGSSIEGKLPFEVRYTRIELEDSAHDLWDHDTIKGDPPTELEFVVQGAEGDRMIQIPENIRAKFLDLLTNGRPSGLFDCEAFVMYLSEIAKPYDFDGLHRDLKYLTPIEDDSELLEWQPIAMRGSVPELDLSGKFLLHFAFYLGEGLYLSKAGLGGNLVVADLESMKRGYGTPEVFALDTDALRAASESKNP